MYGRKTSHEHEYRLGYWLWQSLDCVDYNKLWKILQEIGIPDHLTCLLRNLYAGLEATVRIEHGKLQTGSKLGKECIKAVFCHLVYLTYMQSTSWETLGWMKHKLWLKAQHSENENHGIRSHPSWQIDGETMETVADFIFLGSKITAYGDCSHEIKRRLLLEEKLLQI